MIYIVESGLGNVQRKVEKNEEGAASIQRRFEASAAFAGGHEAVLRQERQGEFR